MRLFVLVTCVACVSSPVFAAGITERACLRSDRSPGPEICSCAQYVADRMLNSSDQKTAAQIIAEPDVYLEYKYASSSKKKVFLERYRRWGETTAQYCTQ